jgi:hypothetical protein
VVVDAPPLPGLVYPQFGLWEAGDGRGDMIAV